MNIYEKLLSVKEQVPYLKKDKKSFQYSYATPSAVFGIINPILNRAKLILLTKVVGCKSQRIELVTYDKEGKQRPSKYEWLYDLDFIFTWVDVETGEKVDVPFKASGCNGEEKGFGSALTYGGAIFHIEAV